MKIKRIFILVRWYIIQLNKKSWMKVGEIQKHSFMIFFALKLSAKTHHHFELIKIELTDNLNYYNNIEIIKLLNLIIY